MYSPSEYFHYIYSVNVSIIPIDFCRIGQDCRKGKQGRWGDANGIGAMEVIQF